ncbi:microtubule-actin cross-linking factor 1, isoforms 1/2/3/4/5-like isoform X2 [Daphnia carinata]|uniref:microtubule-actin cross-linking factor 1, isoforms 1/2/3/4/5-like isoform X2 n=1 Tax=Daphnia carinata TaxID=120202 RepID=UPI002868C1EC|nr:microtubule-actin cross-linking factor 1, isoforms 1/2/3/4/5-like isoform X2 [Daphnia carinata]
MAFDYVGAYGRSSSSPTDDELDYHYGLSLEEWARDKPLSILQLDPADRAVLRIADERDAIQKKTFTKWVNKHLRKIGRRVDDLFEDLRDGHNLVSLLEVLSGDHLPRERGQMRFHMLQNVQTSLDYLRYRKIKLVNIRAEDIVDSNPKLTLGLIWTIILHFQISDIMVGQDESLTAREALLRWAQRTTAKYPGVRVKDFTSSWKDGLAFNAIIHRNRPDLVDWRSLKNRGIRDRLESAFNVVEREYGVTRLLDPEDVDTPEPDEKSLITYISSLYDVFPNPPALHPLYDPETQRKYSEYRELSSSLHVWIRESTLLMQDRTFPNTLIEVKKLALESNRFRTDEVPPRLREKQHITRLYKDIEKFLEETEEKLEPELRPDVLERNWNQLLALHQERDAAIHKEMERLERLQRIAEKVHREAKQSDARLDDIEARIDEEAKRLDRLHPRDAMHNCEALNAELAAVEEAIKIMFTDVQALKDGRYNQTADLHKRVQRIHQRWQSIRAVFQTRLLEVLPSLTSPDAGRSSRSSLEARLFETNEHFRFLRECSEWVRTKLTQMEKAAYGSDLPSVQIELESHLKEHKSVDKFQSNVEKCISNKIKFQSEETVIYVHHVSILQKSYNELSMTSKKRLADLEMLQDFIQSATTELIWLNEKEEIEISRDWSSKSLNVTEIERYYEALMSELEKREIQVSAVQDRGEALVLQHHPASKCVEAYMSALSTQWKWLLQLTLCLETHLRHAAVYHNFFTEVQKCEQWCIIQDQLLNSTYSQSEFTLDEGEKLLKEMQDLREDLSHYSSVVEALYERSREVVPLKQRRSSLRQPITVTSICIYKQVEVTIGKDEVCKLVNNSSKTKWKVVTTNGVECQVPSVCLLIPPPDPEATEAAERLKRQYDRCEALWLKKQMRMSQNMIFATIKVVKSWDLSQFMAMGKDQRDAIRKALNEDAEKLLQQGDPNDPQLRRLQREIDEVNQLFDEFERRAAMGNRPELSQRAIGDQLTTLLVQLEESERTLTSRITAPLPRDLDQLEQLVVEHKHFETNLQSLQPELESAKENVDACPRKTPSMQTKLDSCITKWNTIWQNSQLYIERLKGAEIVLNGLDEATKFVSRLEIQLASCENMPSEPDALRKVHDDLVDMQQNIQEQQGVIDQLAEEAGTVRQLVVRSRQSVNATIRKHPDVDRLESEVKTIVTRWSNICTQVVERLQSCETTFEHLERYTAMTQVNHTWMDAMSETVSKMPPVENGVQAKAQLESTAKLYNGVAAKKPSMDEANILGARLIREAKQAMEERYKLCDDGMARLLVWISNVEAQLANQDTVREDVAELKNQINVIRGVRDDLESHSRPVNACLDQVRQIVSQGGEFLSADEIQTLEGKGQELKKRYDHGTDQTEKLLRKVSTALDELHKFRTEITNFKTWMVKSNKLAEDKERQLANLSRVQANADTTREFFSDVIAHQADLRFITMAAQKFVDESMEYLAVLNDFRDKLPQRMRHIEPSELMVKAEVVEVTQDYQTLMKRANRLSDKMTDINSKNKDYQEIVTKAKAWLKEVEPKATKIVNEPLGAEPKAVEDQLGRAKALNNDVMANERLVNHTVQAATSLLTALDGDVSEVERSNLESVQANIQDRYKKLLNALADKCQFLDNALVQSQDVQEALDSLANWLSQAENQFKNMTKPTSLNKDRLDEQLREHRVLVADIDSHRAGFESINEAAAALVANPDNARVARKIEAKMKDMNSRYEKLQDKVVKRGYVLEEIYKSLDTFIISVTQFDEWYQQVWEILDSSDQDEAEQLSSRIEDISQQKDQRRENFDNMLQIGRTLVIKKDLADTTPIKEKIKTLEMQWKDLSTIIEQSLKDGKARTDQLHTYEKLRDQVLEWLTKNEGRVDALEPVAVDADILKRQTDELRPIMKEYRDYETTISRVADLGTAYENMSRPAGDTSRKPSIVSPSKRSSITTLRRSSQDSRRPSQDLRRQSQDLRSPSPIKVGMGAPLSPLINSVASSGFGSRRSSQDFFGMEDSSIVQKQIADIYDRYGQLGSKLHDRKAELELMTEEAKKHADVLKTLAAFLDKVERQLPRDSAVPQTRDDAEKQLRSVKNVLEDMYDKQPQLDGLKIQVTELLRRKSGVPGADALQDQLMTVSGRWKDLQDRCKARSKFLEDVKDFHDTHDQLSAWLIAKDRMMSVLGPISSDPRLVHHQLQQVQVLREEFKVHEPQVQHLERLADVILEIAEPNSNDGRKVNDKVVSISAKWSDLIGRLEERKQNLDAASGTSRQFYANLGQLQDALQKISDNLEELAVENVYPEEILKHLEDLQDQLESQRPLIAGLETVGEQLCAVLSDASSKAEVAQKLSQIDKMHAQLQKKLDNRRAELENLLKDNREFEDQCGQLQEWLGDCARLLVEALKVSADRDVLRRQLQENEPAYKEVMDKEHEVIMMLDKGQELANQSPNKNDAKAFNKLLEKIRGDWNKVRLETVSRHRRLQTCMELCRKYDGSQEMFLPWLDQAEAKLNQMQPVAFKKSDLDAQVKDLQSFRNDISRHSATFETNKSLGESFLSACDVDKEGVKSELTITKERWDQINAAVLERSQSLEDIAQRLAEFIELLRDSQHAMQRCEDRLSSHDALGPAARDSRLLDRIRTLLDEAVQLEKGVDRVQQYASGLVADAASHDSNASHIQDQAEDLARRYSELRAHLEDRCNMLETASVAVLQFNEHVKAVLGDLSTLETELDSMSPAGRDLDTLNNQLDQTHHFLAKLEARQAEVEAIATDGQNLVSEGHAPDAQGLRDQLESLRKQTTRLEDRGKNRLDELEKTLVRVESFYDLHSNIMQHIEEASNEERAFKPIVGDVELVRQQQEEFRRFKQELIIPLSQNLDEANRSGQGLVQSAANGVSTSALESDLEKMNDRWNNLKEKLNDRERRLDVAFLQSGKFQEALQGLSKWLSDTEEMVANQKPPSADYKVVKAQLQEQKFLKKLLLDRQQSMSSLLDMGQDIANHAHPEEQAEIEEQLQELVARFDALTNGADDRMDALEKAMAVAKEFQDKFSPIADWLEKMERKIKDMEIVPTDEEKIQQRIEEHDLLHDDILSKKPAFDSLTDIATNLMSLVGEEEASVLADRLTELTDRYGALVENSEALGRLLSDAKTGLRHLVLSYEDLLAWMESMESKLFKYRILSVHVEKLQEQMEELMYLTEEVAGHQPQVESVVDTGLELMRHITNEEALQLKEKLDSVQRRYTDLTGRADDLLKHAQETLPLVEQFHVSHNRLANWLLDAEDRLQALDSSSAASGGSAGLDVQESIIARLESELSEVRPFLDMVNQSGPQLCQRCPGEGSAYIESLITRDNRRFDAICEQIQRKAERLHLSKQRSMEVVGDLDELLDWFRETEQQLRESEPPSSDPEVIRVQLKEHKVIGDEISTQKGRVRDILSAAQKVLRESPQTEDSAFIREKMEDLKETRDRVSELSADRLSILEQALPLAEHFYEAHSDLSNWLGEIEEALSSLDDPAIRPDQIVRQQEGNKLLMADVAEHKPLFDKLNKTGTTLAKLCIEEEGVKVHDILESDNARYAALRSGLRERQQALEEALQETSQFSDKLDGMLAALATAFEQVKSAEPVSAHPDKIQEQMQENQSVVEDLEKRESAFEAVKRAADEVIVKNPSDPAVKDIEGKLKKLSKLWDTVVAATGERGKSLEEALAVAERFWEELQAVMTALKELQDTLVSQEPPAVEPAKIHQQQATLQDIKTDIEQTKPEVEHCRQVGQELISLCGEPDKPEVKKHIEELDSAWDNITALYAKREENLIDAMEKAMEYHDTLNSLAEFLEKAENKFHGMRPLGSDIETVKEQIEQLKAFKAEVDPQMVKVETLNRQAGDLADRTSPDQAARLKEPLAKVNRRWEDLLRGVVDRQRELEHALLRLGQFQHALNELLVWIQRTDTTLDELKPVFGDPNVIEVELAKLKVLINDIQAHQTSVDTLNDAGRQLVESGKGSDDANKTQQRLVLLNKKWSDLVEKASSRQKELEDALREAQKFTAEIQDLLLWLNEIDGALSMSKPVGGLPETASEQLQRFMEVYNDLEHDRPLVESCLQRGADYVKRSTDGAASSLQHNLRTLKQRWDNVMNRANDKKIKLEIALKEATEFHDALQAFIDWLTNAEKTLGGLKPASRVMETVLSQIEEHKSFQKDIAAQREVMLSLDKKGTHLKYFSQKQDVILIKNLLISVQHRWERVLSRAAERTRALDHAYKEAKEYHDSWQELYSWLDDAEKGFDDAVLQLGKDPEKIKQLLAKHKEFQRTLGAKQPTYDGIVRLGKLVKDRAPKTDEPTLKQMMSDLKAKWQSVCNKSVDRQRKLEEGLLFSGQFKDAIQALVDWLCKTNPAQMMEGPVHGDLDTVMALREQHKNFEEELNSRLAQTKQVRKMAVDVMANASEEDRAAIQKQVSELDVTWENVSKAASTRSANLDDALVQAETLHKAVNMLLEWLSDAEMKLRFAGALPDEEPETKQQLADHHKFLEEVIKKETDKDDTLALAQDILGKAHPDAVPVIRHWITIIQARWEEVMAWANQREHRLNEHLRNLREMASILEELLAWLATAERTLVSLEAEPLPDDLPIIEGLIKDHQEFMEDMAKRQPEVDRVCKTKQAPRANPPGKERKPSRNKSTSSVPDREFSQSPTRESSPEHDTPARRSSRVTPDRENSLIPRLVRPSYKPQSRESTPGPQQQSRKPSQATSPSPARDGSPSRDYPKPWMSGASRSSPGREKTPDNYWPHIGPRFAPVTPAPGNSRKGSKVSVEMLPRNPRARQLWDRWRNVWMMAWDRQRRLQEKLNYLQELEKVKNFSWDDWRRRFMKYMNHKKSRVTDLFRKMDKNNEGFIPREDFIDGIMKTKFPTSRMEMNAVANMFDRNNEGYIDWKEFLAALRPDWEERPTTEDEIIHDEVKRAVNQCTCRNRFKVHQVGEGQYRFGDSQKLRLVRILRSTVMVRVGGGWVALDEFLVKNDPCRVVIIPHIRVRTPGEHEFWCPFYPRGRTNLELREQFILPEGASQGMTPFKTKAMSPNSSVSSQPGTGQIAVTPLHARSPSLPTAGPITKVRERTVRSSPMRPSFSAGTPDSSVSESDGSFHLHSGRKASAPPRTMMSGAGSHSGSRPASRNADSKHGSIQSLDSYDGGYAQKTPTGIRRTPSFQRPDSSSRNQPGSSSTLPRKRSTIPSPVETRARHPSGSSASGVSPSPSGGFNGGGISAASRSRILRTTSASNIPVLTSTPSRSRIPVYVGVDSEDGNRARPSITASHRPSLSSSRPVSRTPSTSNIPVLTTPSQRGRTASGSSGTGTPGTPGMMRREGTSDSMTGIARKTTSTGIRKPSGTPLSRPSPK